MAKFNDAKWRRDYRFGDINEGLSHDDAYEMLDIAAQFTSKAHVAANQRWFDAQDLYDYIKSDHIRSNSDRKKFYKAVKREFPMVKESKSLNEVSNYIWMERTVTLKDIKGKTVTLRKGDRGTHVRIGWDEDIIKVAGHEFDTKEWDKKVKRDDFSVS